MMTSLASTPGTPALHVFEQAGGWHWGITIPRAKGSGFKLIAFSESTYPVEDDARRDGCQALVNLAGNGPCDELAIEAREPNFCKVAVQESEPTPTGQEGTTMDESRANLTAPLLSADSTLWFSAYGFGWGYCAFALPAVTVCEKLGAANETPKELLLAFKLGQRRLLQAVEQKALSSTGERITLSNGDL